MAIELSLKQTQRTKKEKTKSDDKNFMCYWLIFCVWCSRCSETTLAKRMSMGDSLFYGRMEMGRQEANTHAYHQTHYFLSFRNFFCSLQLWFFSFFTSWSLLLPFISSFLSLWPIHRVLCIHAQIWLFFPFSRFYLWCYVTVSLPPSIVCYV